MKLEKFLATASVAVAAGIGIIRVTERIAAHQSKKCERRNLLDAMTKEDLDKVLYKIKYFDEMSKIYKKKGEFNDIDIQRFLLDHDIYVMNKNCWQYQYLKSPV